MRQSVYESNDEAAKPSWRFGEPPSHHFEAFRRAELSGADWRNERDVDFGGQRLQRIDRQV